MKHQAKRYKLGRDTTHRAALWYNLTRSLILYGKIVTTDAKARSMLPFASRLIAASKEEDLSTYRFVLSKMRGDEVVAKKILEYGKKYKDRSGGYFSIVKIGQRQGDSAHLSCIMLV